MIWPEVGFLRADAALRLDTAQTNCSSESPCGYDGVITSTDSHNGSALHNICKEIE